MKDIECYKKAVILLKVLNTTNVDTPSILLFTFKKHSFIHFKQWLLNIEKALVIPPSLIAGMYCVLCITSFVTYIKLDSESSSTFERSGARVQVLSPESVKLFNPEGSHGVIASKSQTILLAHIHQARVNMQSKLERGKEYRRLIISFSLFFHILSPI